MASYLPPSEQLPIFDNEVFAINTSDAGLTIAQANLLYLRKTFPDTATALETFQGGILTDNIDVINAATTKNLFTSQTAGANLFGNLGAGSTLRLGNQTTGQSCHVSQIDIKASTINNIVNDTGAITIGGKQTTGILYLGTGEGIPRSGQINIGTVPNTTCSISIGSSVGTGGNITIRRPLTLEYTTAPISTQLGYIYTLPLPTFPVAFGASPTTRTFTIALGVNTTGVWGIHGTASINCTSNGTITSYKLYINSSGVTVANQQYIDTVMTTANPVLTTSVSAVAYGPSNSITLSQEIVYTGAFQSSATNFNFSIVRIA